MGLFGKKQPSRDDLIAQGAAEAEAAALADEKKDEKEVTTGNDKVDLELTKIYAQLESFNEIRKANSERFSRMSEQMGEVRGMIVDTNKAMSKVEVAATKAVDLVESVHPEKLMIEVRKIDGKVESLRANIESNEAITKDLMAELKKMRDQMSFYKGTEQVMQMNEEVKQELANIKKMEAVIERHADKVETIFLEMGKKFSAVDKFDSSIKDIDGLTKKLEGDFDKFRVKMETKEDKKEFTSLVDKFNSFEQHTTNLLKLLDERSKTIKNDVDKDFKKLKKKLEHKLKVPEVDLDAPEPSSENDSSGSDVAGGDIKEGMFSRFKKKIISKKPEESGKEKKPDAVSPDEKKTDESSADKSGDEPSDGTSDDSAQSTSSEASKATESSEEKESSETEEKS